MRISTLQAFNNGVAGLQRNYANATRTQEQISTGNRILTPADDPVASVRLLQLDQQQNVLSQYNANLTAAKNSLTQEEVTLNSVNTVLQRVRELAVQAGNGGLSAEDRKSIAAELREREDELLSLMNTRNARGEYLFSGFQGKTQPFVRAADGSYSYQGDEGQRKLQIASSLNIPISDSGKSIFENVINAGRYVSALDTTAQPGSTLSVSGRRWCRTNLPSAPPRHFQRLGSVCTSHPTPSTWSTTWRRPLTLPIPRSIPIWCWPRGQSIRKARPPRSWRFGVW